jgi:hypothetical protein
MSEKEYFGFIEFSLKQKTEYHKNAVKLNCARQAINYIIKAKKYKKVFLPFYICNTVYDALEVDYEFYYLNQDLTPKIKPSSLTKDSAIIYPNYFGTNDDKVLQVISNYKNVIIDNTQAFFQKIKNCDIVYSPRKFFWVTDGAYLNCSRKLELKLDKDVSYQRMMPLFKRIELGSNSAYKDSLVNEDEITNSKMKEMSLLTDKILQSIDYLEIAKIRKNNFAYMHKKLSKINEMKIEFSKEMVPMVYPLVINKINLREKLLKKKIYIPQWWKEVIKNVDKNSYENYLSNNLLPLPIDHRYNKKDLDFIISQIISA